MLQASKDGLPLLPSHFLAAKNSDADLTRQSMDGPSATGGPRPLKKNVVFKDIVFKSYIVVSMTFVWSAYALTLRYSRTRSDRPMYLSTTVVFLAEFTKFFMAGFLLLRTHRYCLASAKQEFKTDFVGKPLELLKMSVPSVAYAIQNNLDFVALSNLDPGVYQVTCQLKVVTTAVFMVLLLGRRYSLTRWLAVVLLFGGVALVQLDALSTAETSAAASTVAKVKNGTAAIVRQLPKQNYFKGLSAVLATCITAGFAGVYFERMLKDATASLWIRNMQMYFCGIISAGLACFIKEGSSILEDGFFHGYDIMVWSIVGLLSVGGIYISLVIKYLDNLLKSFASAVSISVVSLLSAYIFSTSLGLYFLLGSGTVCSAILLYSSVPE